MMELIITDYIPQRPPFVMIDSVKSIKESEVTTIFQVNLDHIFCEEGFFKTSGMLENIAQSAAFFAGYSYKAKGLNIPLGFMTSIKSLEVKRFPKVNEYISTTVTKVNEVLDFKIFKSEILDKNNLIIAQCELRIFIEN